jgi:N-acetylglucosaminyl-diphospho-decaprenol L-rhamnosyltransferase
MSRKGVAARVDVVVVSYNSGATLRRCVGELAGADGLTVTVVDNASPEDPLGEIVDLDVRIIRSDRNGGFSYGCNRGVAAGDAPYVLLLNPDARVTPASVETLAAVLDRDSATAVVSPLLLEPDGAVAMSQRRFPTVLQVLAQALFLHHVLPRLDERVRDPAAYRRASEPDWVSGACMLIRRSALAAVGGMDERYFLYSEDTDVCRSLRDAGHSIRFEPAATAEHIGGASGSRAALRPVLAESRVLYARKHHRRPVAAAQAAGVALGELTHAIANCMRPERARGHLSALAALLRRSRTPAAEAL